MVTSRLYSSLRRNQSPSKGNRKLPNRANYLTQINNLIQSCRFSLLKSNESSRSTASLSLKSLLRETNSKYHPKDHRNHRERKKRNLLNSRSSQGTFLTRQTNIMWSPALPSLRARSSKMLPRISPLRLRCTLASMAPRKWLCPSKTSSGRATPTTAIMRPWWSTL